MWDTIQNILIESWAVTGEMAPYLLFGFLVAGVLSVWLSPAWLERHLGGRGLGPIVKASLFGVPLPLCSCGVIPVSASIRRSGASRASTASFLLSTPQTGVDSILITYAMLGPFFAVFRPVAALFTGVFGGALIGIFGDKDSEDNAASQESPEGASCDDGCCDTAPPSEKKKYPVGRALKYGLVTLPADIGVTLVVGIAIAGLMSALIPQGELAPWLGSGVLAILILMVAGVPVYVCATASVPIAAGFIHMGATPGAALAFLIAGPATNAAAFTTMLKVLGRKSAFIYLGVVAAAAFGLGVLLDWLMPMVATSIPALEQMGHQHEHIGWFQHVMAVTLLLVVGYSLWRSRRPKKQTELTTDVEVAMPSNGTVLNMNVSGMTCSHCSASVQRALAGSKGVTSAEVDLQKGKAVVTGEGIDPEQLAQAINELGYEAVIIK